MSYFCSFLYFFHNHYTKKREFHSFSYPHAYRHRPLYCRRLLAAIFNFLSDEAHGKRANYMAHKMRHSLFFWLSLASAFPLTFSSFYLMPFSPSFWTLPCPVHVRNCPQRSTSIRKEHFLAISSWAVVEWVERYTPGPRLAQMNGHYVYPKWKRRLKWIFNEDQTRRTCSVRCSELSCRQRTCFNRIRRKLHLNAAACRQLHLPWMVVSFLYEVREKPGKLHGIRIFSQSSWIFSAIFLYINCSI